MSSHEEKVRSAVDKLLCMSNQTCPDVSLHVSNLASSIKNATEKYFKYALKIIKQLQNNNISLWFYNLGKNKNLRIAVYVDPSLANSSNGGYLISLVGENRKCSWQSKRIKRVVLNFLSAETLALRVLLMMLYFYNKGYQSYFLTKRLVYQLIFTPTIDLYTTF